MRHTIAAGMQSLPATLPRGLAQVLRGYAMRVRAWTLLADAATWILIVGSFVAVSCLFDRFVDVAAFWRLPLPWIVMVVAAILLVRLCWRATRRPNYDAIALVIDRASGDSRDHLRTLLDTASLRTDRLISSAEVLRQQTERMGLSLWSTRSIGPFISTQRPTLYAALAAVLLSLLFAAPHVGALRADLLLQRFLYPGANHARPSATWFETSQPIASAIREGDNITLTFALVGKPAGDATPRIRVQYTDGSVVSIDLTRMSDGQWQTTLADSRQDFSWTAILHDARSAQYFVRVMPRPTITATTITYEFPSYTRLKAKTEIITGRTVTAVEGTHIRIDIVSNAPLRNVVGCIGPDDRRFRIDSKDPTHASLHLNVDRTHRMAMQLTSVEGVDSKHELPFTIRAVPDSPPVVSLVAVPEDREYADDDAVVFGYKTQDDIGLAEIVMRIEGGDDVFMNFRDYGATQSEGTGSMTVADLAALAGNAKGVKVRIVARDTKGQESSSQSVTIRLAFDSFENQLRLVRKSMTIDPSGHNQSSQSAVARAAGKIVLMRAAKGRLIALTDSLTPGTPLNKDQLATVAAIEMQLGATGRPIWGTRWYTEMLERALLDRFRNSLSYVSIVAEVPCGTIAATLHAAAVSDDPRAAFTAILSEVAAGVERQETISTNVSNAYLDITRELVGFLAATLESRVRLTPEHEKTSENFLATNRIVLQEIADMASEFLVPELTLPRVDALRAAATDAHLKESLLGAGPLLREFADVLAPLAHDASMRANALSDNRNHILDTASVGEPLLIQLGTLLEMQNADRLGDDLPLTQYAYRYVHSLIGGAAPFVPLGDRNAVVRAEDELLWRSYHALQWLRIAAIDARTRIATGQVDITQPEFIDAWARMREAWLGLSSLQSTLSVIRPTIKESLDTFLSRAESLRGWTPPLAMQETDLVIAIRSWERGSDTLSSMIENDMRATLSKLRSDAVSRLPLLRDAFVTARTELQSQAAHYSEASLPVIRLRLTSLQIAVLKTLDLAEASRLAGTDAAANVDQLLGLYTMAGHLLTTFVKKVAIEVPPVIGANSGAGIATREKTTLAEHAWKSRVEEYKKLDPLAEGLLHGFAAGFDHEQIQAVIKPMLVTTQYMMERQAIVGAGKVERAMAQPRDLLSEFMTDRNRLQAVYGELFYHVYALCHAIKTDAMHDAASITHTFSAILETMPELPAELKTLPELVAKAGTSKAQDDAARGELVAELGAALEDLKTTMGITGKARTGGTIDPDQLAIARSAASVAMGVRGASNGDVIWAVTRAEINRRKGGLSRKNVANGGMGLIGDDTQDLKLPKHLYLELKRSRERAMPELFRDRSYDYLNTILEKAQ